MTKLTFHSSYCIHMSAGLNNICMDVSHVREKFKNAKCTMNDMIPLKKKVCNSRNPEAEEYNS